MWTDLEQMSSYRCMQQNQLRVHCSLIPFDHISHWLSLPAIYYYSVYTYILLCIIHYSLGIFIYFPWPRLLHLNNLGEGHTVLLTCDHLHSLPKQWWKSHRRLVRRNCVSSVRRTNGCVGMTGCIYICIYHHAVQTLVVSKADREATVYGSQSSQHNH